MERQVYLCVYLCIRFQLGSSFGNAQMVRKIHFCIRFQVGNYFIWEC